MPEDWTIEVCGDVRYAFVASAEEIGGASDAVRRVVMGRSCLDSPADGYEVVGF